MLGGHSTVIVAAYYRLNFHPPYSVHLPSPFFVAMSRVDQTLDEIAESMRAPRPSVGTQTRCGVRAAEEPVGDRVSAERGNSLARPGRKGRRRARGREGERQ